MDRETAKILIVTGPSSVGKTTVLRALQLMMESPAVVLPADDFSIPEEARSKALLRSADRTTRLSVHRSIFRAYYRTLVEWQRHGFRALGETIFKDSDHLQVFSEELADTPHLLVRLTCTREARVAREKSRPDRSPGLSDETAEQELTTLPLSLELDTTSLSATEIAEALLPMIEVPGPAGPKSDR